jgi:tetratricopeptide (TPR) repeat protein
LDNGHKGDSFYGVSTLLIGLLGALLATNQAVATSNLVEQATGISVSVPDPKDPVEKEFQKLMDEDDEAQGEVDQWIRENAQFEAKGAGMPKEQLRRRILDRLDPVDKAYQDFIRRHPNHTRVRVAYASFLGDTKGEDAAQEQLEKALELDTNNPAIYNNLANIYGHIGPVKKAFEYYIKATQLNPIEPVYYHNFGTTVYLFRRDAEDFFNITEQQVFAKAFELYSNAMRLDPQNFPLASDVAQTYYGIKPLRTDEALQAWTNALAIAHDEVEREGVYVHFARINMLAGRFAPAHAYLNAITNDMYSELKGRLVRNLNARQNPEPTNASPPAATDKK